MSARSTGTGCTNYSKNGQTFIDLNSVSDYLDLTQWDEAKLAACNVANAQQCVPVSMTGRIFYWNKTTFDKAGISLPHHSGRADGCRQDLPGEAGR